MKTIQLNKTECKSKLWKSGEAWIKYQVTKPIIHYLTNHSEMAWLADHFDALIVPIKHPYIKPEWTEEQVVIKCADIIKAAVSADLLVMNGEYFLVATILKQRLALNKKTGFISMQKLSPSNATKTESGHIVHTNTLKPTSVRWI